MIHSKNNGATLVEYHREKEAKHLGIKYVYWRDVKETGEWVLSDDGFVLRTTEVKYITELQKRGKTPRVRRRVKTGLCVRYPHGRMPMNIEDCVKNRSYGLVPKKWWEDFEDRYPAVRHLLMKLVLTGQLKMSENRKYTRAEYDEIVKIAERIFDTKHKTWYHIRTYFGREEVRDQIRKDIIAIAERRGITPERVFDLLAQAEKIGTDKKDGKILIAIAREYAGIIGMAASLKDNSPQLPPGEGTENDPMFDMVLSGTNG
jgi:hypothetical protein